jgi:hypothetical protein
MKKLLPSITLAIASLAAFSGAANAWGAFGLFSGCHCCSTCGGTITLRQYNAFSPVACGSMMFQGCVLSPPPAMAGYGDGGSCGDGSCASLPGTQPAMAYQGGYYYPNTTYAYGPGMQMPQVAQMPTAPQMQMQYAPPMQQMPAQVQQMPAGPASAAMPASVRVP